MNSGVARAIREEFPEAYIVDCLTQRGDDRKLGSFTTAYTKLGKIINLYGQYNYGRDGKKYTLVDKLEDALEMFAAKYAGRFYSVNTSVCIPRIGCGLGGADWDTELVPMIERQLVSRGFKVHVYDK